MHCFRRRMSSTSRRSFNPPGFLVWRDIARRACRATRRDPRALDRADRRHADALKNGDDEALAMIERSAAVLRGDVEKAKTRLDAALDALSAADAPKVDD